MPANFAPYRLARRELDVALVPYWYFQAQEGRRVLDLHLVARHHVACHIPPRELAQVRRFLSAARPGVRLARRAMEGWSYEPALAGSSSSEPSGGGSESSSK